MKKIICLMHYDTYEGFSKRAFHLAACTKADYVFSCFEKLGIETYILSASGAKTKKFEKGETKRKSDLITIELLPSFGKKGKFANKVSTLLFRLCYFIKVVCTVKNGDIVWVYHSLAFLNLLTILKKIRKCKIILEVEELYGDVIISEKIKKKELQIVDTADAFIFPSLELEKSLNKEKRPYAISHGTYDVSDRIERKAKADNKIHVVYAGTLDIRMGSNVLIDSAKYLPENYHIHVIGGGTAEEIENLKRKVISVSNISKCKVSYDGIFKGEEYLNFLSKCDIGVCPHNPWEPFNATSFPSKILSYMSNGLSVVSIRIPTIEKSDIGSYMYYYDEQDPEALANAIINVDLCNTYNSKEIIRQLDNKFMNELDSIIKML